MSIHHFIGGSSAILLAWLGATFLHEVPSERYPKLDRSNSPISASISTPISERPIADINAEKELP